MSGVEGNRTLQIVANGGETTDLIHSPRVPVGQVRLTFRRERGAPTFSIGGLATPTSPIRLRCAAYRSNVPTLRHPQRE
mgnify:CR=1 FL=1